MRRLLAGIALALALQLSPPCYGQSIDIFFDAAGTDCDATVPQPFSTGTIYVMARLGGPFADGITGAEFRITGAPTTWFYTQLCPCGEGNVLREGVRLGSAVCQSTALVPLLSINYMAPTVPSEVYLRVEKHTTPSNPAFQCPVLVRCDAPAFTLGCVAGGQAIINGPPCTVGAQPSSWSRLKLLFE
jgi:hypothetical protein